MNERVPWQGWRRSGEDAGLPAAKGPGSRRPFGATWWGRAWLEALEHRARLDPGRLSRGRSYARRGSVLELTVSPGSVDAVVQGSRVTPYQVTVRIRAFTSAEWDAVLEVVSSQIGRVAALLDGELPPEVVDDVHAAGLDLLPGAGEVLTNCSCPDFAVPCKHSAAVCYLVTDALDDDPFALLLLRGRRKDELLNTLRSRRTGPTPTTPPRTPPPPGIPAIAAFAKSFTTPNTRATPNPATSNTSGDTAPDYAAADPATPSPISGTRAGADNAAADVSGRAAPENASSDTSGRSADDVTSDSAGHTPSGAGGYGGVAVPVPPRPMGAPGSPAAVRALDPPRSSGVDIRDLIALATDAAHRAWEFASGDGDAGLRLTSDQDLARRASHLLGTPELADLAHRAGVPARQLTSWAVAWREGGPGGLSATVETPTDIDEAALAEAAQALPGATIEANRVTAGKTQLRLGPDALWYRFDQHFNDWTLTRPPSPDPQDLLTD
ncbi:SWIM zinc finger family protein [Kribbella pittospori]|uniref:SWIM zinc finger family protein n=1 Tax=Kribbella pittospori TaxID=722689 RepID=UPI001EE092F8|nr:SWIM zinc finger family protein [Kribbella pittospori]